MYIQEKKKKMCSLGNEPLLCHCVCQCAFLNEKKQKQNPLVLGYNYIFNS